jgi:aldose 1-epimerase
MIAVPRDCAVTTLAAGRLSAGVAPGCGARLAFLQLRRGDETIDLLRPATAEALAAGEAYGSAGFPLVPYSGPIFGGGFRWAGTFHPLARNYPGEPVATHGEGWISPWTVETATDDRLTLRLDHRPSEGSFPFAYRALLDYSLDEAGLDIALTLVNRDFRPMPAGFGFHPYFPRRPATRLSFDATGLWPSDSPEAVGQGCGPLPPALDFARGQPADEILIDRCFEGWDGRALIEQPDQGIAVELTADAALGKLQIYSAWDYPYTCVEPVSNANDGFNRLAAGVPCHGVAALDPGRRLAGRLRIALAAG